MSSLDVNQDASSGLTPTTKPDLEDCHHRDTSDGPTQKMQTRSTHVCGCGEVAACQRRVGVLRRGAQKVHSQLCGAGRAQPDCAGQVSVQIRETQQRAAHQSFACINECERAV